MNPIDNQKIMDYLGGKLSPSEQHEVEHWMLEHPFDDEAMEGLLQAGGSVKVQSAIDQLNKQLRKNLQDKKMRRKKRLDSSNLWTYVAVIFILILAVIVYFIIRQLQ